MHGTGFKDGAKPRAGYKQDAEGNITRDGERRQKKPFDGKPREDGHPYDRKDGTGKARRVRKERGENPEYKKKGEEGEEEKKGDENAKPVEEVKREPKIEYKTEVVGYSLDEVMAGRTFGTKKEARKAEGVKAKTVEKTDAKEKQSTVVQNTYMKGTSAPTTTENQALLGFGNVKDDSGDEEERGGGTRGRGGRRNQEGGQRGGRRQNAKQALKKTEEDFPSL